MCLIGINLITHVQLIKTRRTITSIIKHTHPKLIIVSRETGSRQHYLHITKTIVLRIPTRHSARKRTTPWPIPRKLAWRFAAISGRIRRISRELSRPQRASRRLHIPSRVSDKSTSNQKIKLMTDGIFASIRKSIGTNS